MFPVLDDTVRVRKSIVATATQNKGFCGGKIKQTKMITIKATA
jgi:hypothetical protein